MYYIAKLHFEESTKNENHCFNCFSYVIILVWYFNISVYIFGKEECSICPKEIGLFLCEERKEVLLYWQVNPIKCEKKLYFSLGGKNHLYQGT